MEARIKFLRYDSGGAACCAVVIDDCGREVFRSAEFSITITEYETLLRRGRIA